MSPDERKQAEALRDYVAYCAAHGRATPVLLSEREQELLRELQAESWKVER